MDFNLLAPQTPQEPVNEKIKTKTPQNIVTYSWGGRMAEYLLQAYTIQKLINEISDDKLIIKEEVNHDFEYDYQKHSNILTHGSIIFIYNKRLYHYNAQANACQNTITSSSDMTEIVNIINNEIKHNNPYRRKNIEFTRSEVEGIKIHPRKSPDETFDDLILPEDTKTDIYDNTIFHLETLSGSNGIILYGRPGTGKTLTCKAVVNEAIKRGYSSCFVSGPFDFSFMSKFIYDYLAPCIVILEDIDGYASDRDRFSSNALSSLLQMLNGMGDTKDKIVFIATTNNIDKLDSAIGDRPARFNRKFRIEAPTDVDLIKIIDLYFKNTGLTEKQKEMCINKQLSGSHIAEIKRTSELLSKKNNKEIAEVFDEAVEIVIKYFVKDFKSNII